MTAIADGMLTEQRLDLAEAMDKLTRQIGEVLRERDRYREGLLRARHATTEPIVEAIINAALDETGEEQ